MSEMKYTLQLTNKIIVGIREVSNCLCFLFIRNLLNIEEGLVEIIKSFVYEKYIIECQLVFNVIINRMSKIDLICVFRNENFNKLLPYYCKRRIFTKFEEVTDFLLKNKDINYYYVLKKFTKTIIYNSYEICIPNTRIKYWIVIGSIEIVNDDGLVIYENEPELNNLSIIKASDKKEGNFIFKLIII